MEVTKETLQRLRPEINAALAAVGAKFGLNISAGSARFDDLQATFKLHVTQASMEGRQQVLDQAKDEFERLARMHGMRADWFGKRITIQGVAFTVSGLNPSRPKNCVKITRARDGKGFICSPEVLVRQLGSVL
jgi:hypothetical protein